MKDIIEDAKSLPIIKDEPIELFIRYMAEQVKETKPEQLCIKGLEGDIGILEQTVFGLNVMKHVSKGQYSIVNSTFKTMEEQLTGSTGKYWNKTQMDVQIAALVKTAYFLWICRQYMGRSAGLKIPIEPSHMTATVVKETNVMRHKASQRFEAMCNSIEHHGCFANEYDMKQRMKQAWIKSSPVVSSQTSVAGQEQRPIRQAIVITEEE